MTITIRGEELVGGINKLQLAVMEKLTAEFLAQHPGVPVSDIQLITEYRTFGEITMRLERRAP